MKPIQDEQQINQTQLAFSNMNIQSTTQPVQLK